jgi:tetratricopeptide (TPR) repeat protein
MPTHPKVTWLGRTSDKINESLLSGFSRELQRVFPACKSIAVYDCFGGYTQNHARKVVLGVEVSTATSYHTHVIKIGSRDAVETDYTGWRRCVLRYNVASRVMVSLTKKDLTRDRVAVIYEDAYRYFGNSEDGEGPQTLETVVFWSILDGKPSTESVERVIRQIYTDFNNCFYRTAVPNNASAIRFFKARLKKAIPIWAGEPWRLDLRRDLLWLVCRHDAVDDVSAMSLIDPFDYVCWALREKDIPQSLVGRSHGDLHGRNVFVGVQRGEAEYPTTFDYGEMRDTNPIVYDFVKLETELKVRLLLQLYEVPSSREAIMNAPLEHAVKLSLPTLGEGGSVNQDARALRAHQLAFAYRFELLLAELTERFHKLKAPGASLSAEERCITGDARIDRALIVLLRVRQEAALFLGDSMPQRGKRGLWMDEYYFGLAIYGLSSAKFDYKEVESSFALVSAAVACTLVSAAQKAIQHQVALARPPALSAQAARHYPYPSYRVPLAHARKLWKSGRGKDGVTKAVDVLSHAIKHYGHSVALMQEYALALAEVGDQTKAMTILDPLNDLCRVFRDAESLARVGRTCKDLGDRALKENPVPIESLPDHPARHWYLAAYKHYVEAFDLEENYYPGVNAATLACILGFDEACHELVRRVHAVCNQEDLTRMSADDRFWILVSQGEALLALQDSRRATSYYRQALKGLSSDDRGMAKSSFQQVQRLAWAVGPSVVRPVLDLFSKSSFKLGPAARRRPRKSK